MNSTQEHVYTHIDKSAWGDGPWQHEPDKVQWVDEATGLDCLAVRNPSHGAWCGYVGITEAHPWFKVGYSTCNEPTCDEDWCYTHSPEGQITVHGGITYSDVCQEGEEETGICHLPFEGRPDEVWWFGFDCDHSQDLCPVYMTRPDMRHWMLDTNGDAAVYRELPYVREQVAQMAEQLGHVLS